MKITQNDLRDKLVRAAEKVSSVDQAKYFADEVVEAHIRKSPRSNVLSGALKDITASSSDQVITYDIDLPSYVKINFHGQGPLVYLKQIHDDLETRAHTNGIAMAAFTNSQSMHTLHTWVQGLAKRGLLAIAVCNGGPRSVIPFNGTQGIFGTNPMAYGLPGKDGSIHCIDMATSEIPYFEILAAQKDNQPLRDRTAVDQNGEFTSDATQALDYTVSKTDPTSNIVPMGGGYKGYYLVYLLELLTSGLIGMPSSPEMSADFVAEEHGATLIVFSPKAMGSEVAFRGSIEAMHQAIQAQKPKQGEVVRIPGQDNSARYADAAASDLDISPELIEKLNSLAG